MHGTICAAGNGCDHREIAQAVSSRSSGSAITHPSLSRGWIPVTTHIACCASYGLIGEDDLCDLGFSVQHMEAKVVFCAIHIPDIRIVWIFRVVIAGRVAGVVPRQTNDQNRILICQSASKVVYGGSDIEGLVSTGNCAITGNDIGNGCSYGVTAIHQFCIVIFAHQDVPAVSTDGSRKELAGIQGEGHGIVELGYYTDVSIQSNLSLRINRGTCTIY
ncbi:MAG: hypothetical protein BWY95_00419 [Bacteroidetes bacterium ADurb.BinA104]|nr:MAG: hypothetical protein BWY95_00419 [Bacteroidetes bacterium ADurb.BinA104]